MSGSGYRPICDTWMLGRCKYKGSVKRYGGYLAGFLIRARDLLGVHIDDPVLHVCGGLAREYPFAGFGPNDMTMDLDPTTNPDFLQDAREAWSPFRPFDPKEESAPGGFLVRGFKAYLIDPPYSEEDAKHYLDGKGDSVYPSPNLLLKRAFEVMEVGQKVGIIHYAPPRAPVNSREVACIQLICGFNNRGRVYAVFEKTAEIKQTIKEPDAPFCGCID